MAAEPAITAPEWERLQPRLTPEMIDRLRRLDGPPYVCPMLDRATGACGVYDVRPIACRTYGFYVERDKGLYCPDIRQRVEQGDFADVVWGNQAAIDRRLDEFGERRTLREWLG